MNIRNYTKIFADDLEDLSFGGYMRAARTAKDMTQKQMADFLKISKSCLCDIEKGRQYVSIELAAKMARKCGLFEEMAVSYAIKDQFRRAKLKLTVEVKKMAV